MNPIIEPNNEPNIEPNMEPHVLGFAGVAALEAVSESPGAARLVFIIHSASRIKNHCHAYVCLLVYLSVQKFKTSCG